MVVIEYPTHANDCDIDGIFEPTEEYLAWRAQFPVGYLLAAQIERNKKNIIGVDDLEIYEYEKDHIADPMSYLGTTPSTIIRWKL